MTDISKYTTKEFWQTAPEGATHYIKGSLSCYECWVKVKGNKIYFTYGKADWCLWCNGHEFYDHMIPKPKFDELWIPEVDTECEARWDSGHEPVYKRTRILAKTTESAIVFEWLDGRKGDVDACTQNIDAYGYPKFRPIQVDEEVKELETVPKWKFDCLVKELEFYQNKLADSNHLHNKIKMFIDKDVWFWENDGENHLESLACPIVIDADTLRKLIKNGG